MDCVDWVEWFQGFTWEGQEAQGWAYAESVLPHHLPLQLRLLRLPRLPLSHANLPLLDMLGLPHLHLGPAIGLRTFWTRPRRHGPWLVHCFLLSRKPACQPMVCHCQCDRWLCHCHVYNDTHQLLAKCLQGQDISHLLFWAFHLNGPGVWHFKHCQL